MKKILIISLLFICTSVNASKIYLFKNKNDTFLTKDDKYNYKDYILEQNQILIVPPENGILSNDIIKTIDYKIVIEESSKNSNINDIEYNETTGSFTYIPNKNVVGEVIFKYYILYDDKKTNESNIYFYVKNTPTSYTVNYFDINEYKIIPSVTKKTSVNLDITEKSIKIDGYKVIGNNTITKNMKLDKELNDFNFYYEKVPNTGI